MSPESRTYTLAVVVEPAEGAWHAYCPTLLDYGAATWGVTREEALEHIREVVGMVAEHMAAKKISVLATPADLTPASAEEVVVTVPVPTG
jgi:predicted RNase H-like HicB family nuclease